ncbi:hypothetical protein LQW54_003604 [Pestalotiopsis sp. IQ-011]
MVRDMYQCVLWGPEGIRRVVEEYSASERYKPYWMGRPDLAVCPPCKGESKDVLDELAAAADITILINDNGLYSPVEEEQVDEFCLKFICGAHKHQYVGKSWQEQPKGRELWR